MTRPPRRPHRARMLAGALLAGLGLVLSVALPASAANYQRISGQGSSWAGLAMKQWTAEAKTQGVTVDYNDNGSSTGRKAFATRVDAHFAVSEIPYRGDTADEKDNSYPDFAFGMLPVVAGGTSLMYHLPVNGQRYDDLKLSQDAAAQIFTGRITRWNDPAIAADNPGVNLPDQQITVVVRSEGSGATAQFTLWLLRQFPQYYQELCAKTGGCTGNSATSYFPTANLPNFVGQNKSDGVTAFTVNTAYTINYDEYAYALEKGFPVAQIKNAAGFYTIPTDSAVAVALTQAIINTDQSSENYLSQDLSNVYTYGDPRTYPLSAYSYMMVPNTTTNVFHEPHGATLGYFLQHVLCSGQETMGTLGYSPLPMNLVLAAMDQARKIPGVDADTLAKLDAVKNSALSADGSNPCNNPTFRPGDSPSHNILVDQAPFPAGCDDACQAPWRLAGTGVNNGPDFGGGTTTGGGGTTTTDDSTTTGTQVCDPDTGVCSNDDMTTASGNVHPVSTVVAGQNGWGGPQTLMVLVALGAAALIIGPPVVSSVLGARRRP